ncbi:MAG: hypothetical protein IPH59_02735 [bacterium]|nr:hypothetical protein [bacterium]
MKMKFVLLMVCVCLLSASALAKTIYVSKAGSNTAPYDTWAKAATSISAAVAADAAGDTILIGRGVYLNSQIVPPSGSTRPNMTYYLDSAYVANGSNNFSGLAQINGADSIPKASWSVYSGNVYRATWTGTGCDTEDGAGGQAYVGAQNGTLLEPQLSISGVNAPGEFYHDLASNRVYVQCFGNVNPNTVEIQVACKSPVKFDNTAQDNIYFGGLDIRMGKRAAVMFLDGSDSAIFRYCKLSRTSYCQTCNPAVIMSNQHGDVHDSTGNWDAGYNRFNVFSSCSIGVAIAPEGEGTIAHRGSGFIGYDITETTFDSCVFHNLPGDGIEVKNSYASGTKRIVERLTVRFSKFDDIGGEGINLYTNAYACSVYGSIFVGCQDAGILVGNSSSGNDDRGNHIFVNNTFYNCNAGLQVQTPYAANTGTFKYNVIYDLQPGPYGFSYHYDFRDNVSGLTISIDSNQIYEPSGSFSALWGGSSQSWATWQAAGRDARGSYSNPGLNTTTFETSSTGSMSRNYGGRNWTKYGAVQPPDDGCIVPGVVTLSTPANGATGLSLPVSLDWADLSGAINYEVQVDNNADFSSPEVDQYSTSSGYSVLSLTGLAFNWRVRAQNNCGWGPWTTGRTFSIVCVTPGTPTLATPANGATNLTQPITLDWDDVVTSTSYQIQIDNNSDFSSVTLDQSVAASAYAVTGLADGATFYWRVRAQNSCGYGSWSASRFFSTACNLPVAPNYVSPANGATGLAQPVALDWSDIAGAIAYQVQVDDNSSFASTVIDQQPASSTVSASGLTGGTVYYWRVRAQNVCGWGSWTTARTFSPVAVDVTAPSITDVVATNITHNSALITWTTDEPSSSQINYGATTSYGSSTTLVSTLVTSHEQLISGLDSMSTYHFRVRSRDAAGNEGVSGDFTFLTTNNIGEGIAPTVSGTYPGYSATTLTDGNLNPFGGEASTWAAESATQPHWVELNLGAARPVERIAIYWAWNTYQQRWMTSQQFRIQAWNGSAYSDVSTISSATVDSCTFVDITPTTTSRIRYYQAVNQGPSTYPTVVWLSEFDIFGMPNLAPSLPTLSSPANAAQLATLTPALVLNNATDPEGSTVSYDFQVSTSAAFATIAAQATGVTQGGGGTTSWTVSSNLTNGTTYYWRVRSYDGSLYSSYSASRSFAISVNTAPTVPTLASPIGGSQVGSTTPTLTLNNSTDAEGNAIFYDFQVSTSAAFGTIAAQTTGVTQGTGGVTSWVVGTDLNNGTTYYWRARAYDGSLYSSYSSNGSFVIGVNSAPTVPNLSSPVAAGQVSTLTPTLTLTNSTDAEGNTIVYDFQVSTSTTFGTIAAQATGVTQGGAGSTSWTVSPNLVNGTTYYWRARAYDGLLYSSYAAYRSFTVSANNAPAAPTLASPAAGASLATSTPLLSLNNATDPDGDSLTYQFQVATTSAFTTIVAQISDVAPGSGTTSWQVSTNLSTGTTYYWRARAFDGSLASSYAAYRTFSIVANSAPTVPTLSSPSAGATLTIATPSLVVNNSTDANGDPITYSFQVATNTSFANIVAQVSGVVQGSSTTSWVVTPSLSSGTTYYWRARAYDGSLYSNYASYRSFSVNTNVAPGAPAPQLPLQNSRVIDMTPDLIAGNATDSNGDALTYQFYLYNGAATVLLAQSPMTTQGLNSTLWTTSITLAPKTAYSWRARAYDGQSWSPYSTTRNFRTNRIPYSPVPSAPIDGDTVIGSMHEYIVMNATDPDDEPLTYDFEVYSDSLLTILIETVNGVMPGPGQTSVIQNAELTPNQFYWWRARANDSTHSSNWCEAEKFYQMQITLDVAEAPSIVSPANGATVEYVQPSLIISWSGAADSSTLCLFELSTSNTFDDLLLAGNVTSGGNTAIWTPDIVLSEGVYYWRAKHGESDYSVTASFSIVAPIFVSPNPFAYSQDGVVVHNLPAGSKFEVYTASGDQVAEIENLAGDFLWDVRNSAGEKLGSGVFLWYVRLVDKTITGKLIVQR